MSILFIVTLLLLAAVAYRIFRKQQESNTYRAERELYRSEPRGLSDETPDPEEAVPGTARHQQRGEDG
ncbi:MAG TPA: hypothetical protein VK421_12630 [Pyrinomonadaceae bacterium]|nr:hypothetical protein [Pyrinomonadaceae bacterium]